MTAIGCAPSDSPIDRKEVFARYDWWDSRDFEWYEDRIPFIETPDEQINEVYYYRWEVLKTHLTYGSPETGYLFTEFMDRPFWSGTYGGISCPLGHQLTEVRWLDDPRIIDDFARYWIDTDGAKERNYSNWYGDALWQIHQVWGDSAWIVSMLPYMEEQYEGWLSTNFDADHGLFFKTGHDDGMEININSRQLTDNWVVEGYRPTLNSYLYGDLQAMSRTAALAGDADTSKEYAFRAGTLRSRVLEELWDPKRQFFFHQFKGDHNPGIKDKSLTYETGPFAGNAEATSNGRELIGYVPWQFNLPGPEHAEAWQFLMDENHFKAPFGPTVTSQSDPQFRISPNCCVWSGQSWPFATTQTLVAMANLLNNYEQDVVSVDDYVDVLKTYTRTQYQDGRPYIAESANPLDGSWFGSNMPNHSEHYLHSGYVDLVLGGLLGIRPTGDGTLVVNPLIPDDWDWFSAENVTISGHSVDVIWDRDGSKYRRGAGLKVWVDGRQIAGRDDLGPLTVALPDAGRSMSFERPHNVAVNNGEAFPEISASFSDPSHPPFWAADGGIFYHKVPTTRWTTEGSPNPEDWIMADFGVTQTIETVKLYFLDDGLGIVPPSSYHVEILRAGAWEAADVRSRIPGSPVGRQANTIVVGPTEAEGVRVTFKHSSGGRTGLAEIEVWTPDGVPVRPAEKASSNLALNIDQSDFPRMTASHPPDADLTVLQDGSFGLTTYQANRWIAYETPNEEDWVIVEFERPSSVSEVEVYLWGDAPRYLARVDSSVSAPRFLDVEFMRDGEWIHVTGLTAFPETPKTMARNVLTFDAIETSAVRILFAHNLPAVSGATEIRIY